MTDSEKLKINPAALSDQTLVFFAFGFEIRGGPVGQMGIAQINVHPIEKVHVHVMSVGMRVAAAQSNIFVQIESAGRGKIQCFLAVEPDQSRIDRFHRASGGKTQHGARIRLNFSCDDACHKLDRGGNAGLNYYFHLIAVTTCFGGTNRHR